MFIIFHFLLVVYLTFVNCSLIGFVFMSQVVIVHKSLHILHMFLQHLFSFVRNSGERYRYLKCELIGLSYFFEYSYRYRLNVFKCEVS